jgi:hypothetical protein
MDAVITQDDEDTESTVSQKVTRAWKGFDKDFKCRGFVYQVGETYKEDGDPVICQSGFHACTTPIDALIYYPMTDYSRYAEVELIGDTVAHEESGQDSKIAASRIRIVREISYFELCAAHRAWAEEQVNEASATGDSGHASATGKNAIAASLGIESRAKASAGNWLVLAAYADHTDNYRLLLVKTAKCGNGENELKPDIWYRLSSDGEFVECEYEGASE